MQRVVSRIVIVCMHGNMLILLHNDKEEDAAAAAYEKAAKLEPRDTMEALEALEARCAKSQ